MGISLFLSSVTNPSVRASEAVDGRILARLLAEAERSVREKDIHFF
jgi:hypothetical protein